MAIEMDLYLYVLCGKAKAVIQRPKIKKQTRKYLEIERRSGERERENDAKIGPSPGLKDRREET